MRISRAYLLIIVSSFLFGTSGIFVRLLAPYGFSSMQMTAIRGVISALALFVFVLLTNKELLKVKFKNLCMAVASGIFMFITAFFYYTSMEYTTIATAVVLMYSAPIYILLFSVLFLKEKLTLLKAVAVVLMLVGMALVSGIVGGLDFNFWGVFFAIAAGICYAGYNIVAKVGMRMGNDPTTAMVYCYMTMGILAAAFADVPCLVSLTMQDPGVLVPLVFALGLFTCAVPYLMYTVALKDVPAGTASALALLEPLAAIIYSMVFFSEPLTLPLAIGIVLMLGAVYLISRIKE